MYFIDPPRGAPVAVRLQKDGVFIQPPYDLRFENIHFAVVITYRYNKRADRHRLRYDILQIPAQERNIEEQNLGGDKKGERGADAG